MRDKLVTVVEHPNYIKRAERLLTSEQMDDVANMLARAAESASFTCLS